MIGRFEVRLLFLIFIAAGVVAAGDVTEWASPACWRSWDPGRGDKRVCQAAGVPSLASSVQQNFGE